MPEISADKHTALMRSDAPVVVREPNGQFGVGTVVRMGGRNTGARDRFGAEVFAQAIDVLRKLEADPNDAEARAALQSSPSPLVALIRTYMSPLTEAKDVISAADKLSKIMWGTRQSVVIDLSDDEAGDPARGTRMLLALERLRK